MKRIKLRIINRSATEAFYVGDKEISRSHDETLTLTMPEADALVAALTGLKTISVSFVSDAPNETLGEDPNLLSLANVEIERLNNELKVTNALLETERELNAKNLVKITELEAALTEATSHELSEKSEKVAVETASNEKAPTETAAPKKAASKGASK